MRLELHRGFGTIIWRFGLKKMSNVVVFIGSHGTGKTTLVNAVKETVEKQGRNSAVVSEVPRVVCELADDAHFFRRDRNSLAKQFALLVGQPIFEHLNCSESDFVFCDRSLLDHWAYTKQAFADELEQEGLIPVVEHFIIEHFRSYDFVFYVPIEFPPEDDGVREDSLKFQKEIDVQIKELLGKFDVNYETVSGNVEERVQSVVDLILKRG